MIIWKDYSDHSDVCDQASNLFILELEKGELIIQILKNWNLKQAVHSQKGKCYQGFLKVTNMSSKKIKMIIISHIIISHNLKNKSR